MKKLCRLFEHKEKDLGYKERFWQDPEGIKKVIDEFKKYQVKQSKASYRPPDSQSKPSFSASFLASGTISASPEKSQHANERKSEGAQQWEWTEKDYEKFYSAVELFKDHQFGNKKLAQYMGDVTNNPVDAA